MKLVMFCLLAFVGAKAQTSYQRVVLADKPSAYWAMGEAAGSPYAIDDSGHGNVAITQGSVYFGQPGALHNNPTTSVGLNGAGYFLTPLKQVAVTQYSLEAWVNTLAPMAPILQDRGYSDSNSGASRSITMTIGQPQDPNVGSVHCGVDGDNVWIGSITQVLVNDGRWHHVVCVFSGVAGQNVTPSQFTIYVDGKSQAATGGGSGAVSPPFTGNNGTTIGIHPIWHQTLGMPNYVGLLDELAVYDYALSAKQVFIHYLAGTCPACL